MNIADVVVIGKQSLASTRTAIAAHLPPETRRKALYGAVLALVALVSYGTGVLMGRQQQQRSVVITQQPLATSTVSAAAALPRGGEVVASKTGSRYYFPWCGGANRISTAHKIWFASAAAAEAHGYTPAANCKGL